MAQGERIGFVLELGSFAGDDLVVWALRGREALNVPFTFEVVVSLRSGEPLALDDLLGQVARLFLRRPGGAERVVHGEVDRCRLTGVSAGAPRYELRIAPRLARLAHASGSRVFQDLSAPGLVAKVLDAHGVRHRASLSGAYVTRPYVVQHQETDLALVLRLLEEEGIGFFFEHAAGGHTLVLFDANGAGPALPAALPVRREEQGEGREHADRVSASSRLSTAAAAVRDFDMERPMLDVSATAGAGELERYEYPDGFLEPSEGKRRAEVRLAQARAGAATWEGRTTAVGLVPGARFEVEGRPRLLCTALAHEGRQERRPSGEITAVYGNDFVAIAADQAWRPPRRTRRPLAPRIETAVVTGPPGEESHVDRHGRVKVLFHWDRQGSKDDRSGCWVRVAQRWAGAGMGASFVPRVGQEVLVRFLGGDADRPVIVGAVYDGANPTPFALPDDMTRSTQRSSSSPGGGGANELCFEDRAGEEDFYLHAQRDFTGEVGADRTATVRRAEDVTVGGDVSHTVLGQRTTAVASDAATQIDGGQTLTVAGTHGDTVGGSAHLEVKQARTVSVGRVRAVSVTAGSNEMIGAGSALTVGGAYAINVGLASNLAVGGAYLEQVLGLKKVTVNKTQDEQVRKDRSAKVLGEEEIELGKSSDVRITKDSGETIGKSHVVEVKGVAHQFAQAFELKADQFTIQVGGKTMLVAGRSGDVQLQIANLTLDASSTITLQGAKVSKIMPQAGAGQARSQKDAVTKGSVSLRFPMSQQEASRSAARYVLEATDGSYRQQKALKADKADHDGGVQLQFTDAPLDKKYRLKVLAPGGQEILLADGVPYLDLAGRLSNPE